MVICLNVHSTIAYRQYVRLNRLLSFFVPYRLGWKECHNRQFLYISTSGNGAKEAPNDDCWHNTQEQSGNTATISVHEIQARPSHRSIVRYRGSRLRSFLRPKKNRFVTLLSTYHQHIRIDPNDPERKPNIIHFYNDTKGGVDVVDKLVAAFRCKRKINRWPVALFCNILDVSASNAFIIFNDIFPEWKIEKACRRRRLFLIDLGKALVNPHIIERQRLPTGQNARAKANMVRQIAAAWPVLAERHANVVAINVERPATEELWGRPQLPARMVHEPTTKKKGRCGCCPYNVNGTKFAIQCDRCGKCTCLAHRYTICENCNESIQFI